MTYYVFDDDGSPEDFSSYRDFHEFKGEVTEESKKRLFIIPSLFSGSDFSKDACTLSNHRVFLRKFGLVKGVHNLHGGFGTYAIAIRADIAERNKEIRETLKGLEEYALLDEEDYAQIEEEQKQGAMQDIVSDLLRTLNLKEFFPEDLLDSDMIKKYAWEAVDQLALIWDDKSWINSDEIQLYVEDRLLIDHCKDLPLLTNRKWSCDQTLLLYGQKLKGDKE